ncbi:MAG: type II toxin-antitoxin system HicB family antitoxin [Roseiarcus sp.]
MRYPIAIEPQTDETAYGVVVPDLPGCFSAADTLEEAIAGAEEAGLAWIETALDAGEPIPPPSSLEAVRAKPEFAGWILSLVTIDQRPSMIPSHASTSRCRAAYCGASTMKRAPPARRGRAISQSSPSSGEPSALTRTAPPRPSTAP